MSHVPLLEEDQAYGEGKRGLSYDKTEDCTISHVTVVVVAVIIVVASQGRRSKRMGVSDHTDHNSLPHLLARPDVQRDRRLNHPQACGGEVREDQEHLTQCEAYKYLRGDAERNIAKGTTDPRVEFILPKSDCKFKHKS